MTCPMTDNLHLQAGLRLEDVTISLGARCLIKITRQIAPGDILTIMGNSGSGKSTLLDFIAGFLDAAFTAQGEIILGGENITLLPPQARKVGLMFQSPLLFPHMSIEENLLFGLPSTNTDRVERQGLVNAALGEVGLEGFGNRDPATLSGGQQTRVALMRLLLAEPRALLLDEPFSSLDQTRRTDIRQLVFSKAQAKGLPVLLVTHDAEDAEAAGGDVVTL